MSYLKNWRKYHAEADLLAHSSESENNEQNQNAVDRSRTDRNNSASDKHFCDGNESSDSLDHSFVPVYTTSNEELSSTESEYDTDESEREDVPDLVQDLSEWASKNNCTRSGLNDLLSILRKQGLRVPCDARTLLKTPRSIASIQKCGGDYLYLGIGSGLLKVLATQQEYFEKSKCRKLALTFNIDGVPLFKSSGVQMWPILCSIKNFEPFVVALFCGNSKPSTVNEYLDDFLHELCALIQNGLRFNETDFDIVLEAMICDAPARAFLKCIKGHNAYYSCERCVIKGTWKGRVVFNIGDDLPPLRSEACFNNFEYNDHQVKLSPSVHAGISCIKNFPLDYMHLVCLGVVKRILQFIKQGPRECRLSHQQIQVLSDRLMSLSGKMPREFARQPRSLYYLDRWKATEFRQFLLYTGPIVLRSLVSNQLYDHFLSLTVAVSILLESKDERRNSLVEYARELLVYFVRNCHLVYGETFVSYNVHSLIHLADDIMNYNKSMNDLCAFPFENHLQKLKKKVKKAQNPIPQVAKRLHELEKAKCRQIPQKIHIYVSTRKKDSCFLLKNNKFAFIKEKRNDKFVCDVFGRHYLESFFSKPCDSKILDILLLKDIRRRSQRILLDRNDFQRKVVCLPFDRGYLLIPMLHSMERF
ncbi:unnamed protein product [Mytilus coruscus]|uniref:Transposase domain-containing protein n=1 Tax=Mytilus coruscus TaxID=42192 RepID=A0A6J8BQX8_MYTCO|nr:unnamed protein product [Mytilus coruscus]